MTDKEYEAARTRTVEKCIIDLGPREIGRALLRKLGEQVFDLAFAYGTINGVEKERKYRENK